MLKIKISFRKYYATNLLMELIKTNTLKLAEIIPTFNKDDRSDNENYRPISLLPAVSKIYEKDLNDQLNGYFDSIFPPIQCGYRKGNNTQNCLLILLQRWRKSLHFKQAAGMLLTDVSKAFDCIRKYLFITKCDAYGVDLNS